MTNNFYVDDTVSVTILGDINNDGGTDIRDIFEVAKAFGTYPEHPRWNIKADIDGNGIINIHDIFTVTKDYGKTV